MKGLLKVGYKEEISHELLSMFSIDLVEPLRFLCGEGF